MSQWLWPCLLLVAMLAAGCETLQTSEKTPPKPQEQAETEATPRDAFAHPELLRDLDYSIEWISDLAMKPGERVNHAVVLGEALVTVEEPTNLVSALALRDGAPLWRRVVGTANEVIYEPTWGNERIVVNTGGIVYQFEPTNGKTLSLTRPASPVANSPAIKGRYAYFGTLGGAVMAYDLRAGYAKARYNMAERVLGKPVFVRNDLFAINASGQYARLTTEGELLSLVWASKVWGRVTHDPAVSRLGIFFTSHDRTLYALDPDTGTEFWKQRLEEPFTTGPWVSEALVITQSADDVTRAFDAADGGSILWELSPTATPVVRDGDRLVMYRDQELLIVDPDSGDVLASAPTPSLRAVLHIEDGRLVIITGEGEVLRLDPTN